MKPRRLTASTEPAPTVELKLGLAPEVTASATDRTISGLVLPYGVAAQRTSAGPVVFQAGSIEHHPELSRIKLLVDHDDKRAVGYCTELENTADGVRATFRVERSQAGDDALAKASPESRTRDGLSVGVDVLMAHQAADGSHLLVTRAQLNEVSLVSLPAYTDARVLTVKASMHDPEPAPTPAPTPAPPAADPAPATPAVQASAAPAVQASATPAWTPAPTPTPPAPKVVSLAMVCDKLAATLGGGGATAAQVTAALADIVPAQDPAKGLLGQDDWLGQLWAATQVARPFVDLFNDGQTLKRMKLRGWRWVTKPQVGDWAGNKAEVPTNTVLTEPAEADAYRIAGGWDVDRIFVDFGDSDMLEAIFSWAMFDYKLKSEAKVLAKVLDSATDLAPAATVASASAALSLFGQEAGRLGAKVSTVAMAPDVWADFLEIPHNQLPWWITSAGASVDVTEGQASVGNLRLTSRTDLAAGTVVAADRRAAKFREQTVRAQALDVAKGGVDLGLYAYNALLIQDARAIWKVSVA